MVDYVNEHHITDILFANNIFKAYSSYTYRNYTRFLTQKAGVHVPVQPKDSTTVEPASPTIVSTDSVVNETNEVIADSI
jgi:hypothetical protein